MGFRDKVKANIPKVDLQSYSIAIISKYKGGKTRAYKEISEMHYPDPEASLLIAFEPGFNSWKISNVLDQSELDWGYFRSEVVPGLVEEAKNGGKTKLLGIDTADMVLTQCEAWTLEQANKKYGKKFTSMQDISDKTSENGYILLGNELRKQFNLLKSAGYGFIWLCWGKEKMNELKTGLKYESFDWKMPQTGRNYFESQADLTVCLYSEVTVYDKKGNELEENIVNAKGKELASAFHSTETMMYFKPTEYISCAGGRFVNLPDPISYSAENFLKAFADIVKGQLGENDNYEELKEKEVKNREEKVQEVLNNTEEVKTETENEPETIESITKKVMAKGMELKNNGTPNKELNKIIGSAKFKTIEDAQKVLDELNKL